MNLLPFKVKNKFEKSGTFAIAPINGVNKPFTKVVTTVPNDAPITTPTAKSTAFPRKIKFLKPSNIFGINLCLHRVAERSGGPGENRTRSFSLQTRCVATIPRALNLFL